MKYALETEHGIVYVSKSEFNDVKIRYDGVYGTDYMYDSRGNKLKFVESVSDDLCIGHTIITESAKPQEHLSDFELSLLKADTTQEILTLVDRFIRSMR